MGETFWNQPCSVTGNQPYTIVFENYNSNGTSQINFYIDLTAAHEMGHWFDRVILGTISKPFSSSPIWTHEMNGVGAKGDYPTFNALGFACSEGPGGLGYVFNGLKDDFNPSSWICANNGEGPALSAKYLKYAATNTGVLNAAVPNFYSVAIELFAEEVAVDTGDVSTDPMVDPYLGRNDQWNCTQTLVKSMLNYGEPPGTYPSPYPIPDNCPAN